MENTAYPLSDHRALLGEGPSYDHERDTLWWFDIPNRRLLEHQFATSRTVTHELPFLASALARIDAERQLLSTEHGLFIRDIKAGTVEQHCAIEADDADTRSNDGRTHPSGAFWISTMGKKTEAGRGAIYCYRKGEVRKLFANLTVPNAISFSPDGTRAYFCDTRSAMVQTVQLDATTGLPVAEPTPFITDINGPDGAVVDRNGNLHIARWDEAKISVYSPAGVLLRQIPVPTDKPTCPVFIGANSEKLAVTTASVEQQDENAGATFVLPGTFEGKADPSVSL